MSEPVGISCSDLLRAGDALAARQQILDLLPPCRTCRGTMYVHSVITGGADNCPDCTDGKVSIEKLVALWNSVHTKPAPLKRKRVGKVNERGCCIVAEAGDKRTLCGKKAGDVPICGAKHVQMHVDGHDPVWCEQCFYWWSQPTVRRVPT